jgi:hypothetical protein
VTESTVAAFGASAEFVFERNCVAYAEKLRTAAEKMRFNEEYEWGYRFVAFLDCGDKLKAAPYYFVDQLRIIRDIARRYHATLDSACSIGSDGSMGDTCLDINESLGQLASLARLL